MISYEKITTVVNAPKDEFYESGRRTCAGCGPALTLRLIAKAAGERSIAISPTGCMYVANTSYFTTPWVIPWVHTQLGAGGSAVLGTSAGLRALMRKGKKNKEKINVILLGGDGGTADMGLSSLSNALLSDYEFLYVLYDNESYANTGIQVSGTTPYGANTTFTPPGKTKPQGNLRWPKNMAKIVADHSNVKYLATASIAYPVDLMNKVRKGLNAGGPAFIYMSTPCPKGWMFDPSMTVELAKLGVQTGAHPIYEIEDGVFILNIKPEKRLPISEYMSRQGRFSHLMEKDIEYIQKRIDQEWSEIEKAATKKKIVVKPAEK